MGNKHHYLSNTYLKNFQNKSEKIWYVRKENPKKILYGKSCNIAKINNYYLIPEEWARGTNRENLELHFSKIESKVGPILEKLSLRYFMPSVDERIALLNFLCMTYARVPSNRDHWNNQYIKLIEKAAIILNTKRSDDNQIPVNGYKFKKNTDLGLMVRRAADLFDHVINYGFEPIFIFTKEPTFITGDGAVNLEYKKVLSRITMPLSSKCTLILDKELPTTYKIIDPQDKFVRNLNEKIVSSSSIICGWDYDSVAKFTRFWR